MQINFSTTPLTPPQAVERPEAIQRGSEFRDEASFPNADKVNGLLADVPEVRAERVTYGQSLAQSVKYPPAEIIDRISRLIAENWTEAEADSSES